MCSHPRNITTTTLTRTLGHYTHSIAIVLLAAPDMLVSCMHISCVYYTLCCCTHLGTKTRPIFVVSSGFLKKLTL